MKNKNLKYVFAVILLVGFIVCCFAAKKYISRNEQNDKTQGQQNKNAGISEEMKTTAATEEVKEKTDGSETFVIFGVDTRAKNLGRGTRSDSIMVVNVDHESKEVRLASIFRDCYASIEGHGLDKINHAHSFGGPDLAIETINRNFDLDVEKYITVNFINVSELIDDIGGIEMDITESETKYINGYIDELNKIEKKNSSHITEAGTYTLDGIQAVAYSRIRYTAGGDYKRAERQRTVLLKIFEKAQTLDMSKILQLIDKFMGEISTNYQSNDALEILSYLSKYTIIDAKAFPNKLWGGKIDGIWYGVPVTLKSNVKDLHKFLYPKEEYTVSDTVQEISNQIEQVADTPNEVLE